MNPDQAKLILEALYQLESPREGNEENFLIENQNPEYFEALCALWDIAHDS